jgi:GTP-binding protein
MSIPQVAIVGRPNVGKSSLLNWLAGARIAVVDDQPGVTRDRLAHLVEHQGRYFELVDTGGMGIDDVDRLTEHIERQIEIAIDSAAVNLFVVDTRSGLAPLDDEVARRLRRVSAPVVCVANKTDNEHLAPQAEEFRKLGFDPLVKVSTRENRGRDDLLQAILEGLPAADASEPDDIAEPEMKFAIVGRRNVGKSTFINALCHEERMIVSEIPGTTRDSVDVRFELDGKTFVGIDTPGLRRTKSIQNDIEYYGMHRAMRSVRRADVVLLFFDCAQPISKVDKQLCDYIVEQHKPCIFVVNKWDQYVGKVPTEEWVTYLNDTFRTMRYAPIAFVTGKTGKNAKTLLNHAQMLFKQSRTRESTGQLNRVIRQAIKANPPPVFKQRIPKIYYATQVGVQPPTIVLFCSNPQAISKPYQRYLLGVLHDELEAQEVPIKLYFRKREQDDSRDEVNKDRPVANESLDAG